jgi:hypothetical protein
MTIVLDVSFDDQSDNSAIENIRKKQNDRPRACAAKVIKVKNKVSVESL